jgi:benzil reductase ((S)-benzoin forming)
MKTHFYITGTTSGLGRALTSELLKHENHWVFGIARSSITQSDRYRHLQLDLSQPDFPFFEFDATDCDTIVLINNAGWIGPVVPLGEQTDSDIELAFGVNLSAAVVLTNRFLKQTKSFAGRRVIINISSGAANYPVASWATYCASKAALDMITKVLREESPEVESLSIAPGIVDTAMQKEIRSANPDQFMAHARFMSYYENGELTAPEVVAAKIIGLLEQNLNTLPVVVSVRDF